ncbi:MAG: hypothetical protein SCARUB_02708 [Candidatus Scalindua rubra]|uniref:Polymerase beta nucleotidyltransferase domain-containing protein n=1 Tax=Candidatus Scalindua rubra TaxID=1872076 RepID=A0A1E3X9C4_9BACT|nr:MAG: hypothetical protein SCARUB_02708 [Candidatus Scalindua rubra]
MEHIEKICKKYSISLCYIFGSKKEEARSILESNCPEMKDTESDIDFAVLFLAPPENTLETYALLSLDLQDIVSPFM